MPLRLIVSTEPAQLLCLAAESFLEPAQEERTLFSSPPHLLALRQGSLRDDLLTLAADQGIKGWFDTPLCIFHELPRRLGVPDRPTLGEYERAVLLAQILREVGTEVFAKLPRTDHFVDAVDTLFGELLSNGVDPSTFRQSLERRPERDEFEQKRDRDLARAYEAYRNRLTLLGKADGRDEWQYCATEIRAGRVDLAKALGGRREIRIFGLSDLRRGWRPFLEALASSPDLDEVRVYSTTATLDLGVPAERIDAESSSLAARLFTDATEPLEADVTPQLISAPDVEREHDEIARRVRALVDGGAAPERIAIVSRKARPHVDYAIAALARVGVPAMARQRFTLTTIPVVRAIRALFKVAADGWTRAGLVELARQPYVECALEPRVINYIGFRSRVLGLEQWEKELRKLETSTREREAGDASKEDLRHPPPPAEMVRATREAFGRFALVARTLDRARPMREWLHWLHTALVRDSFSIRKNALAVTAERFDIIRRDLAALDGVMEIVRQWREAIGSETGDDVTLERFHEELSAFLSGDAAIWTPACRGVQVLEGSAAAYRSFDHVFIVGMQAGAFPALVPQSSILDEAERDALAAAGLPIDTRDIWDDRERELFRVLVAGARRSLTLSFARLDELGRDVVPSSFIDSIEDVCLCARAELPTSKVVIEGVPLVSSAEAIEQAAHAAAIEHERAAGGLSPYNGRIDAPDLVAWLSNEFGDDRKWSPTQLEELAKCPWAFFSKRALGLEKLEDPDEDMDPATRGSVLHLALQHFYRKAKARVGRPVFLTEADRSWADPMLDAALEQALTDNEWRWLGHPVLRPAQRAELSRILRGFIAWEIDLHAKMTDPGRRSWKLLESVQTGADDHELEFNEMVFEQDGVRIVYRGSIDRVDVSVDPRTDRAFIAAIDYKSSVYSTPGSGDKAAWTDGVVLQVPLYAHALRTLRPGTEIARVEYQTLKNPQRVHSLELYTIGRKSNAVAADAEATAKWQRALDTAIAHVKRARNGEFPASPPETCKCPQWCHGRDICRVKGGPRELQS